MASPSTWLGSLMFPSPEFMKNNLSFPMPHLVTSDDHQQPNQVNDTRPNTALANGMHYEPTNFVNGLSQEQQQNSIPVNGALHHQQNSDHLNGVLHQQSSDLVNGVPNHQQSSNLVNGVPQHQQSSNLGNGVPQHRQSSNLGNGVPQHQQSSNLGNGVFNHQQSSNPVNAVLHHWPDTQHVDRDIHHQQLESNLSDWIPHEVKQINRMHQDNRFEDHKRDNPALSPRTGRRPSSPNIDTPFFFPQPHPHLSVIDEVHDESTINTEGPSSDDKNASDQATPTNTACSTPCFNVNDWMQAESAKTEKLDMTKEVVAIEEKEKDEEEMERISKKLGDMSCLVRQHLVHVENRLFEMFGDKEKLTINISKFLMGLTATGMRHSDPRLKEMRNKLKKVQERMASSDLEALNVSYESFMGIVSENLEVVVKAFSSSFVIPDFRGFCHHIDEIYASCLANTDGTVAQYIPQLARSNPQHWAVSICTVDGQRYSMGDVNVPFTLQSCSKPLTYALVSGMYGTEYMHNFIGMEPSGRYFNELCLDYNNKPHNPMINAGAIMTAALLKPDLSAADRFDFVFNRYKRLAGNEYLGFNNAVFLSEKECADRNFALAYFMRENKCFPEGTRLHETLDFYFQLCSLEINAESGAVMAATLANGGINPLTGDPVLTVDAVRNTLTLMHSCGMYNYSGQFAFKVGLPSKSGVSGCVLLVVPNTMGICLWSPPLDSNGNSCRSVQFCMEMVSRFNFHNFDNLRGHVVTKFDPRMAKAESKAQILFDLLFSAAAGDLSALRRHSLSGTDMGAKDYDGRTALHVATSEGHAEIVAFLLQNCHVCPLPKDRWGRTPLDDASSFENPHCGDLIIECCKKRGIEIPLALTDTKDSIK
ncbi:glutaminase liver isoform, mitochondrial-like isoform X2 [Homarus americanus]|uniref:glutaminase liver isoform, mitochondrial-like isoform X2 n=1 Tax=Homarus americanus TaxID=6706 RepID=UPI001C454C09|nr:glutaminase liver isoform, mitochondrial-like isoform X2 [Homarus americanus]